MLLAVAAAAAGPGVAHAREALHAAALLLRAVVRQAEGAGGVCIVYLGLGLELFGPGWEQVEDCSEVVLVVNRLP